MARQRPPKRTPSAKAAPKQALKGGLGSELADKAGRYELSRPGVTEQIRKKMLSGSDEARGQFAESVVAAAYQHLRAPDDGSRVYGKAFNSILQSQQDDLLRLVPPEDADVVRQAFGQYVDAEPAAEVREPRTREERIKAVARAALEDANLEETVNLDAPAVGQDAPRESIFTAGNIRYTDEVVNEPRPEWTKGQAQRGYRLLAIAPRKPGDAPRYVREVLPRVLEAERAAVADAEGVSPSAGKAVLMPRSRRPNPAVQTVDRMAPTPFDELSPEKQRAVVAATELNDQIRQMEAYDPAFLDTPEGRRLAGQRAKIIESNPDVADLINDAGLEQRAMPRDPINTEKTGAQALPPEQRLGWHIGSKIAQKSPHGWETRPDRRSSLGVPADAPNRMGWLQTVAKQIEYTDADGKKRRKFVPRSNDPALEGGVGEVQLPYPTSMIGESREVKDIRGDFSERIRPQAGGKRVEVANSALEDAIATDAELEAALGESKYGPIFSQDAQAKPVAGTDMTMSKESWEKAPDRRDYVLTYGTAEGSPAATKRDRDFALREGKSARDKLAEKLFRAAQEFGDIEAVADNARTVGSVGQFRDYGGEELAADAIYEATGGGGQVRKRSGSSTAMREIAPDKLLDLDGLVPIWRGFIEDVEDGQITARRPTSMEVAGFLVDRAEIPDPSLAARLEPLVRASMEAQEQLLPKGKAKRVAGVYFPSGPKKAKALEARLAATRAVGDDRPRYSQTAQSLMEQSQKRVAESSGWQSEADAMPAAEAPPPKAIEVDPAAVAAFSTKPAGSGPVRQRSLFDGNDAGNGGNAPTNIAGLLAMLTGLGAGVGGSGEAEAGELPPVEYLAMAKRKPPRRGGGGGGGGNPPPPKKPAQPAPATPPEPWISPYSPVGNMAKGAMQNAGPYAKWTAKQLVGFSPDIAAIAGGVAAFPYVAKPVVQAYQSLFNQVQGGAGPQPQDPMQELNDAFNQIRDELPQSGQPAPQQLPPMNNSTSRIMALRQMLG